MHGGALSPTSRDFETRSSYTSPGAVTKKDRAPSEEGALGSTRESLALRPAATHFAAGAAGAADVSTGAAGASGVAGAVGVAADVSVGAAVVEVGSTAGLSPPPHATEHITSAIETKRAMFFIVILRENEFGVKSHAVHPLGGVTVVPEIAPGRQPVFPV